MLKVKVKVKVKGGDLKFMVLTLLGSDTSYLRLEPVSVRILEILISGPPAYWLLTIDCLLTCKPKTYIVEEAFR